MGNVGAELLGSLISFWAVETQVLYGRQAGCNAGNRTMVGRAQVTCQRAALPFYAEFGVSVAFLGIRTQGSDFRC